MKLWILVVTLVLAFALPAFGEPEFSSLDDGVKAMGFCDDPGPWIFDLDRTRKGIIGAFCALNECGWEICYDELLKKDTVLVNGIWYEVRYARVKGKNIGKNRRAVLILRSLTEQPPVPWWYSVPELP